MFSLFSPRASTPGIIPIRYGSFSNRIMASTIDLGVVMLFAVPLIEWLMTFLFLPVDENAFMPVTAHFSTIYENMDIPDTFTRWCASFWQVLPEVYDAMRQQRIVERVIVDNVLQILAIALYVVPFWLYFSSTPGKMLFRMRIEDAKTGEPMSRKQAIGRFGGYILSTLLLSFGFLWILFSKRSQGFHDILANTVVIVKSRKSTLPSA